MEVNNQKKDQLGIELITNLNIQTESDLSSNRYPAKASSFSNKKIPEALSQTFISHKEKEIIANIKAANIESQKTALRKLIKISCIALFFMGVEIAGGLLSGSIAVLSDAAHMFGDFLGFAISMICIIIAKSRPTRDLSFGYHRAEVIGAMGSVFTIWGLTVWLVYEAIEKIHHDEDVKNPLMMLIIAIVGLLCNLLMGKILHDNGYEEHGHSHAEYKKENKTDNKKNTTLHEGNQFEQIVDQPEQEVKKSNDNHNVKIDIKTDNKKELRQSLTAEVQDNHQENLTMRAATIHILGDMLQSIGVVLAATAILIKKEWYIIDPILTFTFSIVVLFTTVPVVKDCIRVFMEGTPLGVDLEQVLQDLSEVLLIFNFRLLELKKFMNYTSGLLV